MEQPRPQSFLLTEEGLDFSTLELLELTKIHSTHRKIFGGNQTIFFGYGIVTIEMFEKKMFQIMCHMMGCNDSSG